MLDIRHAPSLAEKTTLRIGGRAIAEVLLHTPEDCLRLPETVRALGGTAYILGAGSNILARDGELPLVLVRPALREAPVLTPHDETTLVRVGAGVRLPRLLGFCAAQGLSGLEGLCGIPGTVGGAVAMNAGSYGTETCSHLYSVEVFTPERGVQTYFADDLEYGYRHFVLKEKIGDFIILGATFDLTHAESGGIKKHMSLNFFKKKSTQPVSAYSAGCVFKNPETGLSAGKLLDQAGFRGKKCGGMAFSDMHANFLINEGQGTSAAAFDLIAQAQDAVARQFGIALELEVRVIPWQSR